MNDNEKCTSIDMILWLCYVQIIWELRLSNNVTLDSLFKVPKALYTIWDT